MKEIKLLNKVVADQIAAGEVVERPASVVKELVENSLDAGATRVQLEITGGGTGRIRVSDNGAGFPPGQVERAFLRHATSKINCIEDLLTVGSLGFRGEALASICSVAKVVVSTRTEAQVAGTRVVVEGGEVLENRETGCPVGTDFDVRDLFYNVPARLKFLKKESTETSHCIEAVVRLALIRPEVRFSVVSNGRHIKNLLEVDNPVERVKELFENEALAHTRQEAQGLLVEAVLGAPDRARAGAGSLYTYVNGRYVRDRALLRAVSQGFGGLLAAGRYPVGFISISLPPQGCDVNVHPQKTEVRFSNPQAVFRAVSHTVGAMVSASPWSRAIEATAEPPDRFGSGGVPARTMDAHVDYSRDGVPVLRDVPEPPSSGVSSGVVDSAESGASVSSESDAMVPPLAGLFARLDARPSPDASKPVAGESFTRGLKGHDASTHTVCAGPSPGAIPASARRDVEVTPGRVSDECPFSSMHYIGQARGMYLLFEVSDALVVMDQHAACERVTYERMRREMSRGQVASQRLLTPVMVDLGPVESDRVDSLKESLSQLGMDVERAGLDRIAVHGVPAAVKDAAPERLLADMVMALEEGREGSGGTAADHALATVACHGSVRAGQRMQSAEVAALLADMDSIDFAGYCPHGRPVLTRFSWKDIEKRVQRG